MNGARLFALALLLLLIASPQKALSGLYAPEPDHVWNQLYDVLMVREPPDGVVHDDLLDAPYWPQTQYLLERASSILTEHLHTSVQRRRKR